MKTGVSLVLVLLTSLPALAYSEVERAAFVQADKNKDVLISKSEFNTLIKLLAQSGVPRAKTVVRWGAYGIAFKRIDANADGKIAPAELEAQR